MSDARAHSAANPFSEADVQHLHAEDFAAAKAVVCLMVGIFMTGIVIYTIVSWAILS